MFSPSPTSDNPFWQDLEGKLILVVGGGKTGLSVVRFLSQTSCDIALWDTRAEFQADDETRALVTQVYSGKDTQIPWQRIDGVVLSPGVSPHEAALRPAFEADLPVIGDVELFAYQINVLAHPPKIVGVTGSNGKTTVTLLIEHLLKSTGKRVSSAGNVGTPVLDVLQDLPDYLVLELSSFQLEMMASLRLDVACFLNLSEDHLDRHGTMDAYGAAKQRIYKHTKAAVFWVEQAETHAPVEIENRQAFSVSKQAVAQWTLDANQHICLSGQPIVNTAVAGLAGLHNILNIQAACAVVTALGITLSEIEQGVASFSPPPHRCVVIGEYGNVKWVDDSKATNPGATLAALQGLGPMVKGKLMLIAGGDSKGADLSVLKKAMKHYVDTVITIGKDGHKLDGIARHTASASTLDDAVKHAAAIAQSGDLVLLSPACASLDMFSDYIHRAKVFAESVQRWAA